MNLLETIKNQVRAKLSTQESEITDTEDENSEETLDNIAESPPKGIFQRIINGIGGDSVFEVLARASTAESAVDEDSDELTEQQDTQLTEQKSTPEGSAALTDSTGTGSIWGTVKGALSQGTDKLKQVVSAKDDSATIEATETVENTETVEDTVEPGAEKASSVWAEMKEAISNGADKLKDTVSGIGKADSTVDDATHMTDAVEDNNEENQSTIPDQEDVSNDETETSNAKVAGAAVVAGSAFVGLKNVLSKGVDTIKETAAHSDRPASILDSAKNALQKGTGAIKDATTNLSAPDSVTGMAKNILTKSTETIKKSKAVLDSSDSLAGSAKSIFHRGSKDQPESSPENIETGLDEAEQVTEDIIATDIETDAVEAVADQIEESKPEPVQDVEVEASMSDDSAIDTLADQIEESKPEPVQDVEVEASMSDDSVIDTVADPIEASRPEPVEDVVVEASMPDDSAIDTVADPIEASKPEPVQDVDVEASMSDDSVIDVADEKIVVADSAVTETVLEEADEGVSATKDTNLNPVPETAEQIVDSPANRETVLTDADLAQPAMSNETVPGMADATIVSTEQEPDSSLETAELVFSGDTDTLQPDAPIADERVNSITDTVVEDTDKVVEVAAQATESEPKSIQPELTSATIDLDSSAAWTVKGNDGVDSYPVEVDPGDQSDAVAAYGSDKDELMDGYIPPLEKSKSRWVVPVVLLALLSLAGWLSVIQLKQKDIEVEEFAMLESTLETPSENHSVAQNSDLEPVPGDLLSDDPISGSENKTLTGESETAAVQSIYDSVATDSEVISEVTRLADDPRAGVAVTGQAGGGIANDTVHSDSAVSLSENISDDSTAAEVGLVAMIEQEPLLAARGGQAEDRLQKLKNNSPVEAIARFLQGNEGSLPTGFILYGLSFETASSLISEDSARIISDLATTLEAYPNTSIRLEGHTDSRGNDDANKVLSTSRANTVKAALVSLNLDPARITTEGLGEEYPIVDNATKAGRSKNRRVEVIITER